MTIMSTVREPIKPKTWRDLRFLKLIMICQLVT